MSNSNKAVIISAARTPTGKFQGALKGFTAPDLGAIAIKEAVKRAGIEGIYLGGWATSAKWSASAIASFAEPSGRAKW